MTEIERYSFGGFLLEPSQQRVLRADGTELGLPPRLFRALLLLVENAGALLDKETLMRALWPGLVVEENNLNQAIHALRRSLGDSRRDSRFIRTVPRRGFRFVAAVSAAPQGNGAAHAGSRPVAAASPASALRGAALAVLPFKPLSDEGRDDLLEVGMADSLIARFSTVPGLVVRSIGSTLRYAGAEYDPLRVARELDATWIVDGSLQRRGDRLRVTARLLQAADGVAAWTESCDATVTDVFEVQDQISTRFVQALAPALSLGTAQAARVVDIGGTRNPQAYEHYIAAQAQMRLQRADGLRASIVLFERAISVDPAYASAWLGLAMANTRLSFIGEREPVDAAGDIRTAAKRALALAPLFADAHAALGSLKFFHDYDWPGAERELRRALALNPNVAQAHLLLGQMLVTQDRIVEGFAHLRAARELDPSQPVYSALEASFLLAGGRRDEGRARLDRTLEIAPHLPLASLVQAQLLFDERRPEEALAALRRAVALSGGATLFDALLGVYLARAGRADEARAILTRLQALSATRHLAPTALAALHAALGEPDAALDALDVAYARHDPRLVFLKDAPYWESLRKEPRFVALMKRLRLDAFGPGLWNP